MLCEDNKQFLLDIYNNQPEPSITYTDVRKVEKEYKQIKDQIDTLKKEAKWYKFETEGVKFDSTTIEYNIGSLIYDCVGMRLVKYTNKNKKTATIEFTRQTYTHDSRGKRVENPEVEVVCIDKIRVSNLKYIVNHYVKDVC
jgi:hypothetical protein